MSVFRVNKLLPRSLVSARCFATALRNEEEYTATPQYPPILDLSLEKKRERKEEAVYEAIKSVKTVEEKQIKLNMARYYGFKCYMLTEDDIPYNSLPLVQHVTRTHLIVNNKLPDFYNSIEVDDFVNSFKGVIEEALLIELDGYQRAHDLRKEDVSEAEIQNIVSSSITKQINRIILNTFSKRHPHLSQVQVDEDSRIESTWSAGGMNPTEPARNYRKKREWLKHLENEPINRVMVYIGQPNLTVRSQLPLQTIIPINEAENPEFEVPFFQYDPRVAGTKIEYRHVGNVPGFWPGDPYKFGLISYHKRGHMLTRFQRFQDAEEQKDALHRQGILASFGWLNAQANFLGFTTFNDITYPLVTQTIITDGKVWSFYVYQLNTLFVHTKHATENPKRNICWATEELNLYEDFREGKIVGLNEDVVKLLFKFYANAPQSRLGVNMTPYLSTEEKIIADYSDDEKRQWLEREYKFLVSQRPRLKEVDEIYSWEKIYKIDHQTRFMEKRLRPFELFLKPHKRRLDERLPKYIPRKLRPDLPRWKGRYAKEFFP